MAEPKRETPESKFEDILSDLDTEDPMDLDALAAEADAITGEVPVDDEALETLRAERDDMRDRWMRALADSENLRKRADRDRREAEQYGGSRLARDLLPIHDNLARALEAAPDSGADPALVEGVELTMRELLNIFAKHGITQIEPELGEKFDPQIHQAMFEAPVPDTKAGDIIQVMAKGFKLQERLLRPAQVGVSSNPAK
ncbi:MAG: nucleotide exchange factor GrpE [Qingshengfaniella sp.]